MTIFPQCFSCKHFDRAASEGGVMACAAFPAGIPDEILLADFDHRNSHPGDNGIRFEPKPDDQAESEAPQP